MTVGELIAKLGIFDSEMQIEIWQDAVEYPNAIAEFEFNDIIAGNCRCQIIIDQIDNIPSEDT